MAAIDPGSGHHGERSAGATGCHTELSPPVRVVSPRLCAGRVGPGRHAGGDGGSRVTVPAGRAMAPGGGSGRPPVRRLRPSLCPGARLTTMQDHSARRVAKWRTGVQGSSGEQHLDGSGYRHIHYRLARRGTSRRANLPYPWGVFSFPGHTPFGRIAWRDSVLEDTMHDISGVTTLLAHGCCL